MEGVGIFIIFIVISIIRAAAKQNKNTQKRTTTSNTSTQTQSTTVQDNIRDLVGQIEKKINEASTVQNTSQTRPAAKPNNVQKYNPSLEGTKMEGYQMEGAKVEGYQMEGAKVEGYKVEGVERKHRHSFGTSSKKLAHTELSMGRSYAGEGCESHYDKDIDSPKIQRGSKNKKEVSLKFSDNPVVQGLVMSQILERPKRRY